MEYVIKPTEGVYMTELVGTFHRETDNYIFVSIPGERCEWKFNKKDGLRAGYYKNQFPRYKIMLDGV